MAQAMRAILLARAMAAILVERRAKQLGYTGHPWLVSLLGRRSVKIAAVALANKIARIAWAMMLRGKSINRRCC